MSPLEGLKVVELARILAGPWIGQTLADLGAEVIKLESPEGDDTRKWGPPFIEKDGDRSAAYFHSCNRGKSSICVNLKTPEGVQMVKDLIQGADIFIENFKVGGLEKYGLDYDSLHALNPRLVYCSVTGFGQTGPLAQLPGYDFLLQGMSGLMSVTGEPDGAPQKVGVAVTDIATGLYGTIGILSALQQRHRTGLGQHIDMSLLDCATAILANQNMNFLATGDSPSRLGNSHPNICPYDVFETADGHVILAVGNDGQFKRCCDLLGLTALPSDPRFETNQSRVKNRETLVSMLKDATSTWSSSALLRTLAQHNVPAGPINSIAKNLSSEHAKSRNLVVELDGVKGVRTPIQFSGADLRLKKSAPALGEP